MTISCWSLTLNTLTIIGKRTRDTTSDQSYLTPLINAGRWFTFDNRDAYQEPFFDRSNPDERFWYINMNENGGIAPFDKYGNMWRLDGDLYGGVLPAVQVIGKRGKK